MPFLSDFLLELKLRKNTFVLGDFNIDLLSTVKSRPLRQAMSTINFLSLNNNMVTRIADSSRTNIDVIFTYSINLVKQISLIDCPFSDHHFFLCSLNLMSPKPNKIFISSRCLNAKTVNLIKLEIENVPFDLIDLVPSPEEKWYIFKKLFMEVVDSVAPVKKFKLKENSLPWVDAELRNWFNIRDKLLVLAHSSSEARTGPAWDNYKEMRNYCKSQLKLKMKKFYEDKTASHFQSSKKFWNFYKSVVKTKKSKSASAPLSIINQDGTRVFDEKLVADSFNK